MKRLIAFGAIALAAATLTPSIALACDHDSRVFPISSHPYGKSYAQWAADWETWIAEIPASINPNLDQTGANCNVNQTGPVWFLPGNFTPGVVSRTCTVPQGKALMVPVAVAEYYAFLSDPAEQRTEAFLRSMVTCIEGAAITAEIDGKRIAAPTSYLEKSALFDVQLPVDNVFGLDESVVPDLLLSPSVDEGYFFLIKPLDPGNHVIHFHTSPNGSCAFEMDWTMNVNIVSHHK